MSNTETTATRMPRIVDYKGTPFSPLMPEGDGWQLVAAVPHAEGVVWYWSRQAGHWASPSQ